MKSIKIFLIFAGLLSFSSVQAATYTASGSTTTYTEAAIVNPGGDNEYQTYTTANSGTGYLADSLIASADTGNSGNGVAGYSEESFLSDVLNTSNATIWNTTVTFDLSNVYQPAIAVYELDVSGFKGGYFLLKFGGGGTSQDSTWIFKNEISLEKLTWLASIQGSTLANQSLERLSHIELCDSGCTVDDGGEGGSSTVPIPAAIWLFGSALIGLMGVSRKQKAMVA